MARLITIVGVGGLGCPAAICLAKASLSDHPIALRLIDPDRVERSNLNRQILFSLADVGRFKVEAATERLAPLEVESTSEKLSSENVSALLSGSDYVIDGTDSVDAKLAINDFCIRNRIPFSYGGVTGWGGMALAVHNPKSGGCVRCLFGSFSEDDIQQLGAACQQQGIVGAAAGVIGILQARAALEYLSGSTIQPSSILRRFEIGMQQVRSSSVPPAADCPVCAQVEDAVLDLKKETCPMTFLHTKLALEKIPPGAKLRVQFGNQKSCDEVSESCSKEGHAVELAAAIPEAERWELVIERRSS